MLENRDRNDSSLTSSLGATDTKESDKMIVKPGKEVESENRDISGDSNVQQQEGQEGSDSSLTPTTGALDTKETSAFRSPFVELAAEKDSAFKKKTVNLPRKEVESENRDITGDSNVQQQEGQEGSDSSLTPRTGALDIEETSAFRSPFVELAAEKDSAFRKKTVNEETSAFRSPFIELAAEKDSEFRKKTVNLPKKEVESENRDITGDFNVQLQEGQEGQEGKDSSLTPTTVALDTKETSKKTVNLPRKEVEYGVQTRYWAITQMMSKTDPLIPASASTFGDIPPQSPAPQPHTHYTGSA